MTTSMNELLEQLQAIGIAIRLKINPDRQSCKNCAHAGCSATGDGWNEPIEYEWECPIQERQLPHLSAAYERATGEVNYDFATICPHYREPTEEERRAESLSEW